VNSLKRFILFYNYKDLTLRLTSGSDSIKSMDFCGREKSSLINDSTPYPLITALQWLNSYFRLSDSGLPEIEFLSAINQKNNKKTALNRGGTIPLDLRGYTEREIRVYTELIRVKPGSRISYGALAEKSGIPSGARFIGNTIAKNRFPLVIPCHRVIRSDGSMGNYTGGNHIKAFLLEHESRA